MNISSIFKGFVLTALAGSPVGPASASTNILGIYEKAVDYDASYAADQFGAQARYEDGRIINSTLLPNVDLSGAYSYGYNKTDYNSTTITDIDRTYDSQSLSLNARQALVRFDSIYQYRRDRLNIDIANIEQEIAEQDLIIRVADIYFLNLKERENLEVAKARKSAFAENLEKANISYQLGSVTITDKLEAQARYDLANADAIEALNSLSAAREQMLLLIGETPDLASMDTAAQLPPITPDNLEHWKQQALDNNLQLLRANLLAEYAVRDVSAQRAEFWPKFDLVGSLNHSTGLSFSGDQTRNEGVVSLQMNMPLISGGNTLSKVRKSVAVRKQARNQQLLAERQAIMNTQTNYLNVINGYSMHQALAQALKSSESAVEATQQGLAVGVRTNLDLLNAQQQYYETKRDYIHIRYDYLLAWLKLKEVSGTLSTKDLEMINQLFASS